VCRVFSVRCIFGRAGAGCACCVLRARPRPIEGGTFTLGFAGRFLGGHVFTTFGVRGRPFAARRACPQPLRGSLAAPFHSSVAQHFFKLERGLGSSLFLFLVFAPAFLHLFARWCWCAVVVLVRRGGAPCCVLRAAGASASD
jgi:hypothetical protein